MHKEVEYKGKIILADTYKLGKGWQWSYQIDDGALREGSDRPLPSEEKMLNEAIANAKREIDGKP